MKGSRTIYTLYPSLWSALEVDCTADERVRDCGRFDWGQEVIVQVVCNNVSSRWTPFLAIGILIVCMFGPWE
jgi:hypothetical protein